MSGSASSQRVRKNLIRFELVTVAAAPSAPIQQSQTREDHVTGSLVVASQMANITAVSNAELLRGDCSIKCCTRTDVNSGFAMLY